MDNKAGSVWSSLTSALSWVNPSKLRSLKGVRKNGREGLCSTKAKECLWQVFSIYIKKFLVNSLSSSFFGSSVQPVWHLSLSPLPWDLKHCALVWNGG